MRPVFLGQRSLCLAGSMDPVTTAPQLHISGDGLTHRGRVRERNEDAILIDPNGELWAVADGMGGHGHGDIAASMVIDSLALGDLGAEPLDALVTQLEQCNAAIYARAAGATMGATIVAAYVEHDVSYLAWVGDSRIYLWRRGRLQQMSKDHSQTQELIDEGVLTQEGARTHPDRNVITRAIGVAPEVAVDVAVLPLARDDRLLLCSDGLTGCVCDHDIGIVLDRHLDDRQTAQTLVEAALVAGAPDNVSVIIVTAKGR